MFAMSLSRASKLKDEGNALFSRRQLERAVQAYSCALRVLRQEEQAAPRRMQQADEDKRDLLLFAVITSNRSACYFEMRDYNHSAIDASSCIEYLEDLLRCQHKYEHTRAHVNILTPAEEQKAVSMRDANQWRRTRALLYQHDGDLHQAQRRLDHLEKKEEKKQDDDTAAVAATVFTVNIPELPSMHPVSTTARAPPLQRRRLIPRESI